MAGPIFGPWLDPHQEAQRDFLLIMINELASRRTAVDVRVSVVSAIAIAQLAGVVALGTSMFNKLAPSVVPVVFASCIVATGFATIVNLKNILPIQRPKQVRRTAVPTSLTWFYDVASLTPDQYNTKIAALTQDQYLELLSKHAVSISSLLASRYKSLLKSGKVVRLGFYYVVIWILVNHLSQPIINVAKLLKEYLTR